MVAGDAGLQGEEDEGGFGGGEGGGVVLVGEDIRVGEV